MPILAVLATELTHKSTGLEARVLVADLRQWGLPYIRDLRDDDVPPVRSIVLGDSPQGSRPRRGERYEKRGDRSEVKLCEFRLVSPLVS